MKPDDFRPGMWVFVRSVPEPEQSFSEMAYLSPFGAPKKTDRYAGLMGVPLRIVAVQLPFVAVAGVPRPEIDGSMAAMFGYAVKKDMQPRPTILDIREVEFARCDRRWVNAFAAAHKGTKKPKSNKKPTP